MSRRSNPLSECMRHIDCDTWRVHIEPRSRHEPCWKVTLIVHDCGNDMVLASGSGDTLSDAMENARDDFDAVVARAENALPKASW